jgi:curli biogenesis system outer membrane secretion channel CsgG
MLRSRRLAALIATAGLVAGAPVASVAASSAIAAPVAHTACTQATIGGQSKCIARGQFCARASQRDYLRYGLSCSKLDVNGRYHLT